MTLWVVGALWCCQEVSCQGNDRFSFPAALLIVSLDMIDYLMIK